MRSTNLPRGSSFGPRALTNDARRAAADIDPPVGVPRDLYAYFDTDAKVRAGRGAVAASEDGAITRLNRENPGKNPNPGAKPRDLIVKKLLQPNTYEAHLGVVEPGNHALRSREPKRLTGK
jgi:hypothetical protein